MNKSSYQLFIIIASLAMLGLVSFQVYWIYSSYQQEQANYDTLTDIATRQIENKINNYLSPDFLIDPTIPRRVNPNANMLEKKQVQPIRASRLLGYYNNGQDSIPLYAPSYVNLTVTEAALDSIVKEVVSDLKLSLEYGFSITDTKTDSVLFKKESGIVFPSRTKECIIHPPNPSLFNSPQTITLTYPNRTSTILSRMKWLLLPNILLFLLISGAFYFAFRIIIRQKKVHQIRRDFISSLNHEFLTPVSTVSLALDGLIDYSFDNNPEKREQFLSLARKENKRLGMMIERTLNMAAFERGQLTVKLSLVDVNALVKEVAANYEIHINHRKGQIITQLDATEPTLLGDAEHLFHAINNLVDNANKFSSREPRITIETRNPEPGRISISITDQGIGIPKEKLDQIFKPFGRIRERGAKPVKGFGLGLSYVRKVVELHQGEVSVTSSPGKGSCFTLFLPQK